MDHKDQVQEWVLVLASLLASVMVSMLVSAWDVDLLDLHQVSQFG